MTPLEQLTVSLIRALNAAVIQPGATDRELLQAFGPAALPLAEGLATFIRDEVARQIDNRPT